jgi:hypothetical protein
MEARTCSEVNYEAATRDTLGIGSRRCGKAGIEVSAIARQMVVETWGEADDDRWWRYFFSDNVDDSICAGSSMRRRRRRNEEQE